MTLTGSRSYAAAFGASAAACSKHATAEPAPANGHTRKGDTEHTRPVAYAVDAATDDEEEDHRSWCSTPTTSLAAESDRDYDTSCASSSDSEAEEKQYSPAYSFTSTTTTSPSASASASTSVAASFDVALPAFVLDDQHMYDHDDGYYCDEDADEAATAAAELAQARFDAEVDFYTARLDRCRISSKQSRFLYETTRVISNMRRVLTQPKQLSAACTKGKPVIPKQTSWSYNRSRNERLAVRPMLLRTDLDGPIVRKESTANAHHLSKPARMTPQQSRALQMKVRNLPMAVRTCTNKRWMAVLQQRLVTKQIVAERNAWRRKVTRTRADKQATARKIKSARFLSDLNMHRTDRLRLLPSEYKISLAQAAHWQMTYTDAVRQALVQQASVQQAAIRRVLPPTPAPVRIRSPFEAFRAAWYQRHREHIQHALPITSGSHVAAVRPASINPTVAARFMRLRSNLSQRDPLLTFHGTSSANHESILERGFLIPGRTYRDGVRIGVANGSAYGRGIYSSTDLTMSLGYTRCTGPVQRLFVCATLTDYHRNVRVSSLNGEVRHHGQMVIFFREQRIVPMFFIDVAPGQRQGDMREEGVERAPENQLDSDLAALQTARPDVLVSKANLRSELRKFYSKAATVTRAWKAAFRKMIQAEEHTMPMGR